MSKDTRKPLIEAIEAKRKSRVLCYLTSTKPNFEVLMAMDSIAKIHEHVRTFSFAPRKRKRIDLFLYSNGGDSIVPWRLITLLREYCEELNVLIPYRAFSAATLTALGADSVVMHRMGMLGPVDPTVSNSFNPKAPNGTPLGISVEDVSAFFALLKEDAALTEQTQIAQLISELTRQVHPLALGNVKRHISQSRMMARKLLSLHMNGKGEHSAKIKDIVENLTSKSYYHSHPINRKEAVEQMGIQSVKCASNDEEELMWNLYTDFDQELENEVPFSPVTEYLTTFPQPTGAPIDVGPVKNRKVAFVESTMRSDVSIVELQIAGSRPNTGGVNVQLHTLGQKWIIE